MPYIELSVWYLIHIAIIVGFFINRSQKITDPVFNEDLDLDSDCSERIDEPSSYNPVPDFSQMDILFEPLLEDDCYLFEENQDSDLGLKQNPDMDDLFESMDTIIDIEDHRDAPIEDNVLDHHDDFIMEHVY